MKRAKLVLLFGLMIVAASAMQATAPIELVRERFVSREAIELNLQAQDQMMKGDLTGAAKTIQLAMQKDPTLWLTYFTRARLFFSEGKYELANADCNWVLRKYPKFVEAALLRAQSNTGLAKYADALKELDHVVRIRPPLASYARALQDRAWFLATCPDASFRNGKQAVEDARVACKLTHWSDDAILDSLASAYAETGDFNSAVLYAQQALAAKHTKSRDFKRIQRHLEMFKQRKPVRSFVRH